jgi:membrane-associated phospholipid phosphatase
MNSFDVAVISFLNQFAHKSVRFDNLVVVVSGSELLKSALLIACMWWIWFENDDVRRKREVLLAGTAAIVPALLIAKILAAIVFRARPLLEPRLQFQRPYGINIAEWQQGSSFPSDHGVLLLALATGIFCASRKAGWIALAYATVVGCLPRLYLGEHYATDVITGAAIGIGCVWLATRPGIRQPLTGWALRWMESKPSQFYCCAFLVSYEIAELFGDAIRLATFIMHGLKRKVLGGAA